MHLLNISQRGSPGGGGVRYEDAEVCHVGHPEAVLDHDLHLLLLQVWLPHCFRNIPPGLLLHVHPCLQGVLLWEPGEYAQAKSCLPAWGEECCSLIALSGIGLCWVCLVLPQPPYPKDPAVPPPPSHPPTHTHTHTHTHPLAQYNKNIMLLFRTCTKYLSYHTCPFLWKGLRINA